jgi:uncharacterized protein (TIGR04141 family)
MRRSLGGQGRIDSTFVPGGLPVWAFELEDHASLVGRAGGRVRDLDLTYAGRDNRPIPVEGAAGLRLRLGVEPADFVSDIRRIARVLEEEEPQPGLESIDRIQPVEEPDSLAELDVCLDRALGGGSDSGVSLRPVVPIGCLEAYDQARSFTVKIGGAPPRPVEYLDLADFLRRTRLQPPGTRMAALRDGHVHVYADDSGREPLGGAAAVKWLEAAASIGSKRYILVDGHWYEIGAAYLESIRARITELFPATPSLDLPAWELGWHEREYNVHVQDVRQPGYVCLDRRGVQSRLHTGNGVEVCDLLGPDDELIHVKQGDGSGPLSHLFAQALVSVETLAGSPEARAGARRPAHRSLPQAAGIPPAASRRRWHPCPIGCGLDTRRARRNAYQARNRITRRPPPGTRPSPDARQRSAHRTA